jgi:hypothetical protein
LNLVVQAGLDKIKSVRNKAKTLVQHFKMSTKALEKLNEYEQQMNMPKLKLKQDVITRWSWRLQPTTRVAKPGTDLPQTDPTCAGKALPCGNICSIRKNFQQDGTDNI